MSFKFEQNINGTTYVYEVNSYWDKNKKQARQKRICIGKKDKITGKFVPSKRTQSKTPKICKEYGNYYLLNSIALKTNLDQILRKSFPNIHQEILTCAFFEISERKPLYLCEQWTESNYTPCNTRFTSQRISELLSSISEEDKLEFFKLWATHVTEKEYIAFDVTSISSYSKIIDLVEYGYNRDGEKLPQINLGMLFGEKSALPIFYNLYPGSIKDVSMLENILKFTKYIGKNSTKFVMDKGFYSEHNINALLENKHKFTISLPLSTSRCKNLIDEFKTTLQSPSHTIAVNDDILHAYTSKISWNDRSLYAHVFYNERNYIESKEDLMRNILALEREIKKLKNGKDLPQSRYSKFLIINRSNNSINVKRDEASIEDYLKYKGFFVILSNDIKNAENAISIYRNKDIIEKAFDNLKNDLDSKRLRVHSEKNARGKIFIKFIALIIQSHINKIMRESKLNLKYTQEELMCEMKKIKHIEFENDSMITEVSKTQRNILKTFKISYKNLT